MLWEACSNLGAMTSEFPHLSKEGCGPQGEEVTGPEAPVVSDMAPSCIRYLGNACGMPGSGGQGGCCAQRVPVLMEPTVS